MSGLPLRHPASRRRRGDRRGQSLVEFAVVFPVFILLLAGMVDFGLALFSNVTIINAAREGARLGVTLQPWNQAAVDSRVTAMAEGLNTADLSVSSTCAKPNGSGVACSSAVAGDSVRVQVDYTYHMVWPLTFGTSIPLSSSVEMRIE
jgi:Flp pilus assembly protein TadG